MPIICKILGHRAMHSGWWGDALYGEVKGGHTDGIGCTHFRVEKPCVRCGETFTIARFHGEQVTRLLPQTKD